eukprot:PhM_4_TR16737/c1_g2_i2/m.30518
MKPTFEVKSTLMPRGKVTEQCHFSGDGQDHAEKRVQSRNEVSEDALEINSNKNEDTHYPQNEWAGQRDVSKQIRKHGNNMFNDSSSSSSALVPFGIRRSTRPRSK